MVGDDRQRAARGGLGGDHPERLRERARDRHRLGGGQQVGELVVVEPAGERDAVAQPGRRRAVAVGPARSRNAASCGSSRPSSPRVARRGVEVAGGERRREPLEPVAERPEPDDDEPRPRLAREHERPRGEQQLDALGRDQLADEDDQPVAGLDGVERRDRLARVAVERGAGSRGLGGGSAARARRAARRSRSAARPARAAAGSRGAKRSTSTPGGPSRVRPGSDGSSISAHRLSAVWREPTSTPRAPARPSTAYGRKRGYGLTVYSSALPWILTAYGTSAERPGEDRRAHHEVVGQRDVRPRPRDDLAHGGDVGVQVALDLVVAELVERARLDALVAVGHVERQQAADVGPVDGRARAASARSLDRPATRRPSRPPRRPSRARTGRASWQSRCSSCPARTSAAPSSAL